MECPFCNVHEGRVVASNAGAFAIRDISPASPGHALVIPRRHAPGFADLSASEWNDMGALLREMRERIAQERKADGFNIGMNDGTAAGQTVPHAHMHLIPRYRGDCEDPTGGIRRLFPGKERWQ